MAALPPHLLSLATPATELGVVANAPALSMAALYQATAQSLALAAHNATMAQQQMNMLAQAATTQQVAMLLSLPVGGRGRTG